VRSKEKYTVGKNASSFDGQGLVIPHFNIDYQLASEIDYFCLL